MAQGTVKSLVSSLNSNFQTLNTNLQSNVPASTSAYRNVWFSDNTNDLKRVHDTDFQYNPGTNDLKVGTVNGRAVSQIVSKTYTFSSNGWEAGTIGTRAEQLQQDIASDVSQYGTVVGVTIVDIADSSRAIYQAFMSGNALFLNAYRATTNSSGTGYDVSVRVTFAK